QDGALDVFVGVDNQGGTPQVRIWDAGASANTSPSTTSVATTSYAYAETAANYAFTAVSSASDPNWNGTTDIDGAGSPDYFVSWQLSFKDLSDFLATQGINGVTKDTTMQYMFATSTQNNALNSDIGGVKGGTASGLTWGDLGALSTPMSAANAAPVITSFGSQDAAAVGYLSGAATPVATMTAVDPNSDTYSWSISGGADSAKFSINSSTGALTFLSSPNFSVPTDVDGDNKYQVEVTVTDSKGGVDKQTLSVEVAASADAAAPTRTATYPADGATGVAVNS